MRHGNGYLRWRTECAKTCAYPDWRKRRTLSTTRPSIIEILTQETVMATLRLKARTKPVEGEIKEATGTVNRHKSPEEKSEGRQAAGAAPASYHDLREYPKTDH
jgi:hypothetical protein